MLLALTGLACGPQPQPQPSVETSLEQARAERVIVRPEPPEPAEQWPPPIPSLLLTTLESERQGSFTLPAGVDELAPRAAVVLGRGLALVGEARSSERAARRWVGFVPDAGQPSSVELGEGSILAAITDGKGGALLAGGAGPEARGWFGALDARAKVTLSEELEGEASTTLRELLAGHAPGERALGLGGGWIVSLDGRGGLRWQRSLASARVHAGARLHDERGDVLAIGTQLARESHAWWGVLVGPGGPDTQIGQGQFEIEGADPHRGLDAIVDLGDMGLLGLGRARREATQAHEQVIAVGFDRAGAPTWSRVLEYFRAKEIYGTGAVNPELVGIANFVVRVPVGGNEEDRSALAWLDISPGVDGILVPRQLAGTEGWESAGFIAGREFPAILAYRRTEGGVDWRVLPLETSYRVGAPR